MIPRLCTAFCLLAALSAAHPHFDFSTEDSGSGSDSVEWMRLSQSTRHRNAAARDEAESDGFIPNSEKKFPKGLGTDRLKLLQLNTWLTGAQVDNGVKKLAKHIENINADVVGLQEITSRLALNTLMQQLGPKWNFAYLDGNCAILSKHTIDPMSPRAMSWGIGATILLNDQHPVHVVSVHFEYRAYGPYAAFNRAVRNVSVLDLGERTPKKSGRYQNALALVRDQTFRQWLAVADTVPLFVLGDLNCPSHLDWVEGTRSSHADWVYQWPATFVIQNGTGLIDAFREHHPDPAAVPGNTWSTVNRWASPGMWRDWGWTIPEPQDRIDFVFYKSARLRVYDAQIYASDFVEYPGNVRANDWPTDHYAVIVEMEEKTAFEQFRR